MSDDQILEVVQAHKEGKQIQLRCSNIPQWTDIIENRPSWNFLSCDYRVKPEPRKPREWSFPFGVPIIINPDGTITYGGSNIGSANIKVREVIDD